MFLSHPISGAEFQNMQFEVENPRKEVEKLTTGTCQTNKMSSNRKKLQEADISCIVIQKILFIFVQNYK